MTKFVDSLGLKRLVTKIAEAVSNGTWLPVRKGHGEGSVVVGEGQATGDTSYAEGQNTKAIGMGSHAEGFLTTTRGAFSHAQGFNTTTIGDTSYAEGKNTTAKGESSHAEGHGTRAIGDGSHAEGQNTEANGWVSHAEGGGTQVSGAYSHAQGSSNYDDPSFIDMVGVGTIGEEKTTKNASAIYVGRDSTGQVDPSDPKNGYQYLLGVGGYQGQAIAEGMRSVQEVIADLEKVVAATETMTVEEIREIMSA